MKKVMATAILMVCVACVSHGELLTNPGFEDGGFAPPWYEWGGGSGSAPYYWLGDNNDVNVVTNAAEAHSGSKYVENSITNTNVHNDSWHWASSIVYQDIPVTPGETYTMSGWFRDLNTNSKPSLVTAPAVFTWEFKYNNGKQPGVRAPQLDVNGDGYVGGGAQGNQDKVFVYPPLPRDGNWHFFSTTQTMPTAADMMTAIFGASDDNIYLGIDDVSVVCDTCAVITDATSGSFEVTWQSEPGRSYDVEYSGDMATWSNLVSGVVATSNSATVVDPADVAARSYRVTHDVLLPPFWFDDIESGTNGWTVTANAPNTEWELGMPDGVTLTNGPSGAHSGNNCWGTDLDGNNDGVIAWNNLTSPVIDLNGVTNVTYLSFWNWRDFDAADAFVVDITDEFGGFLANVIDTIDVDPVWSKWIVAIPPAARNQKIKVQFLLFSGVAGASYAGVYIDDVAILVK